MIQRTEYMATEATK